MSKIIPFLLLTIGVFGSLGAVSSAFYLLFFCRKNRPNYLLVPGECCMQKVKDKPSRQEFFYKAGHSTLKGYYYPAPSSKKLVVLMHGFRSGADDYLALTKQLVCSGFCVFCFDCTGTYDSKGNSLVGMCQPLVDLDNTLHFIKSTPLKGHQLYLIGHSLGGYAVLSALALHKDIKACVAIAPVNDGSKILIQKAEQFVGKVAQIHKPFFDLIQKISFGNYTNYNSVQGINCTTAPVLIVQGLQDKVVTHQKISVTAHKTQITNPNVVYWEIADFFGGHSDVWHSKQSVVYKSQVQKAVKRLAKKTLNRKKLLAYYNTVDNALYSQVNEELMQKIIQIFNLAV